MTAVLGISAFYHDSAAALVVDGAIVAAAQEERFTRRKHDAGFPAQAIAYCLDEAGLTPDRLDCVAFYEKPAVKFGRLLQTYVGFAPFGFRSFRRALPVWLREKLFLRRVIRTRLKGLKRARLVIPEHHESHAASAFFPSPFDDAAILTLDGVGEWTTTATGTGSGHRLQLNRHIDFPHSLGLLYSAFTSYCGFRVNSGEYKLMGLAPYGQPIYAELIRKYLIDIKPDGSFWLDMRYFDYCTGFAMTSQRFHDLFGGPPRTPDSDLFQRHMDLAASIQAVTEEVVLRLGRDLHARTGQSNLVLAGGVALNCVANGRLLREGPFKSIWIQPAAGDAGGALGAALFAWHQVLGHPRRVAETDSQKGSLLGPSFSTQSIQQMLWLDEIPGQHFRDETELLTHVARLLSEGKVVGWFHGRMEFGPRALGARSILGDARSPAMQATMNLKIKFRESFRPFAPCVLQEHAHEWFDLKSGQESPYMLLVAPVRSEHRTGLSEQDRRTMTADPDLRHRVNIVRSDIPAVTHIDYSVRIQTVDAGRHPRLHRLLTIFHQLTGCPVLVNTSFKVRGEPIVCTPRDAYRCFLGTDMDTLVLEDLVVHKSDLKSRSTPVERREYLARFQPD